MLPAAAPAEVSIQPTSGETNDIPMIDEYGPCAPAGRDRSCQLCPPFGVKSRTRCPGPCSVTAQPGNASAEQPAHGYGPGSKAMPDCTVALSPAGVPSCHEWPPSVVQNIRPETEMFERTPLRR